MTSATGLTPEQAAVIHQVGPRYAVRDYLRRILVSTESHSLDDPNGWQEIARRMTKGRMPRNAPDIIRDAIANGPQSGDILSIEGELNRILGKQVTLFHVLRGSPACARLIPFEGEGYDEDWLLAGRETIEIRHDRVEFVLNPYGVAFTRHMLERVYERESVNTGEMDGAMTSRISDLYGQIAYNVSRGLTMPPRDERGDMRCRTLVPFGDGLAIVERRRLTELAGPESGDVLRASIRHGRIVAREVSQSDINVTRSEIQGHRIVTRNMWVATTYLSDSILRPEQRAYRDLHRSTADEIEVRLIGRIMWDVSGRVAAMRQRSEAIHRNPERPREKIRHGTITPAKTPTKDDEAADRLKRDLDTLRRLARQIVKSEPEAGDWTWSHTAPLAKR